jgi:hypothetical protein
MKINIYEKPVLSTFIKVDGIEFEYQFLLKCLQEIRDGKEKKDYELSYIYEMNRLVEIGLVEKNIYLEEDMFTASYRAIDTEKIEGLIMMLYEI